MASEGDQAERLLALIIPAAEVGYLLTFVSASVYARRGSGKGRAAGFAVGVIVLPPLALLAFFALVANALRCDDNCDENLPGWSNHVNGWQWEAGLIATVAALLFAIAAVVLLAIRKEFAANLAAVIATVCVAFLFAFD